MNSAKIAGTVYRFLAAVAICTALHAAAAAQNRPMELADMFRVKRVSDPQISPDGKWVAYVVGVVDKEANRVNTDIWRIPIGGGEAKQLTNSPKHDRHPRWSPDSKEIVFESNRGGSFQIYTMSADGSGSKQLTSISTEATGAVWSPDGKNIAFVSAVYPEFSEKAFSESDALNKKKDGERESSKVKARVMTKLLYRHWDSWVDDKRQHIFVVPAAGGTPKDLTPGDRDAVPTSSTFSAGDDFDISPDGKELAYTATPMPAREEAWSTNHDIYTVKIATGERKQLTTNPAADTYPRYSRDGKYIAYRAQSRPGFEADRWQLMLFDRATGATQSLTGKFDANVDAMAWTQSATNLFFPAEEKGYVPLWTVSLRGNDVRKIIDGGVNGDITVSSNGRLLVFTRQSLTRAVEIYTAMTDGKNMTQLTHVNDALFSEMSLPAPEYVWYTGAEGVRVQMWIVKPPGFSQSKKYPLVYWVHGGPQTAFLSSWSYRWNPELWAAQ
jgi:dipeptidyl aminopeptidase/acylaminoacyl peptidase